MADRLAKVTGLSPSRLVWGRWVLYNLRHKTHGTPLGSAGGTEATVAYAWHPWFGLSVVIHDLMVRSSGVFARCRLDGAASGALQEIPGWMLDPGACSPMRAMAVPVVSLPALATLAALLSEVLTCAAAALSDKAGVASRDHQYGDRHAASSFLASAAEATARPLCGKPTTDAGVERPSGSGTQTLTGLMTRLLLAHAGGAKSEPRSDRDER